MWPSEVERNVAEPRAAHVDAQRLARAAEQSEASWSSSPVWAPAQSFSMREQSRASASRSGGSAPATSQSAQAERHADGRRGGQAGAAREVARDRQATAAQLDALARELGGRAAHERAPALGGWPSAPSSKLSVSPRSLARASIAPPARGLGGDRDAPLDGERKAQAVVVVGVLADHVDAPGSERLDTRALRRGACSRRGVRVAHSRGRS